MRAHATITTRIGHARERVESRLAGVRLHVAQARRYAADPWIRFGTAVAVGYWLGRDERPAPKPPAARPRRPETMAHAVVRTALTSVVTAAIRRALASPSA